jgi:hypothetical protein
MFMQLLESWLERRNALLIADYQVGDEDSFSDIAFLLGSNEQGKVATYPFDWSIVWMDPEYMEKAATALDELKQTGDFTRPEPKEWQILHEETPLQRSVSAGMLAHVLSGNLKKVALHDEGGTFEEWLKLLGIWGMLSDLIIEMAEPHGFKLSYELEEFDDPLEKLRKDFGE